MWDRAGTIAFIQQGAENQKNDKGQSNRQRKNTQREGATGEDIKKKEDAGPKGRRIKGKCFACEEQGYMKEDCPKQLVQTQAKSNDPHLHSPPICAPQKQPVLACRRANIPLLF